jgi:hypothetical protein
MHVIIRSVTNLKILDKKSNSKVKNDREIHIKILFQVLMLNEQENNVPSIRKIAECQLEKGRELPNVNQKVN